MKKYRIVIDSGYYDLGKFTSTLDCIKFHKGLFNLKKIGCVNFKLVILS